MRKTTLLLSFFGLLAVASLPTTSAHAQATRTWVSGVGDDANPCSRTAPCKTFSGAISRTAAGGEINCMDPGGFGAVTITKSITIDCLNEFGSILAGAVNAINVNAGATDKIVIRNLSINGTGTTIGINGISFTNGGELHVDNVSFENFSANGIFVNKTALGELTVRRSSFSKVANGIRVQTTSGNVVALISDSSFNSVATNGVEAGTNSFVGVSNSVFMAAGGSAILSSTATSTVYAKNNMITNSGTGINASISGARINASGNGVFGATRAFNAVAGASFLSFNDNVSDINPGSLANGSLAVR